MWGNYIHWLHGLPLWGQVFVIYFLWSFAAWLPLLIWEQRSGFHERRFHLKWWQAASVISGLYYARHQYPWINSVMSWPGRYLPHWHGQKYFIVAAVVLAAVLARRSVVAVTRLRGSRSSYAPDGYDEPEFVTTFRRNTFNENWED
jgi:hypothetical protein